MASLSASADPDGYALRAIQQYLSESGYGGALAALEEESGVRYSRMKRIK